MPRKKEDKPTADELAVLKLRKKGYCNKMCAGEICISVPTVKTRINKLFAKLDVDNINDAWHKCIKEGYIILLSEKEIHLQARYCNKEEKINSDRK